MSMKYPSAGVWKIVGYILLGFRGDAVAGERNLGTISIAFLLLFVFSDKRLVRSASSREWI